MYCKNCGNKLEDGELFCTACGTDNEQKEAPRKQPAPQVYVVDPNKQKLGKKPLTDANLLAILGFIFAFLSPIVGLVLYKAAVDENSDHIVLAKAGYILSIIFIILYAIAFIVMFILYLNGLGTYPIR